MLSNEQALRFFNQLYGNIDGYSVSHEARRDIEDKSEILYGELPPETWQKIVERTDVKKDGVFVDVGSGTGRIVMLSHLMFDFKKCIGIELLQGLYDKSCEVKEIFDREIRPQIASQVANRELDFLCKNILDADLRDADLLFMNHPFKDRALFEVLEEKFLRELQPKTKIVTTIRALKNPAFKQLGSEKYEFSWGESTAYFHEV